MISKIRTCVTCKKDFMSHSTNGKRCGSKECERERQRSCRRLLRINDRVKDNERVSNWRKKCFIAFMFTCAKSRAKRLNLPFSIMHSDIVIPSICPVLGIPLVRGNGKTHPGSPSLDRISPSLGYVPGNICVISHKANRIKNDASIEDIKCILNYMENKLNIHLYNEQAGAGITKP